MKRGKFREKLGQENERIKYKKGNQEKEWKHTKEEVPLISTRSAEKRERKSHKSLREKQYQEKIME